MNRVFLVDDDDSILKLYKQFLEFKGFNIIDNARNGIEALNKYKGFKIKPDLIIMDHHMPLKNGIETTKELLKFDGNVKVFLISGDSTIQKQALAAGAISFKKKPFNLQDLYSTVLTLICSQSHTISSKFHAY